MGITPRELMQPPKFEGLGKYVYCRPGNGDWSPTYTFEFFGGQVSVEVDESEIANPPVVGSMFQISGHLRRSSRNGSISLAATEKKFVSASDSDLSLEQAERYVGGLRIYGVGVVKDKQSSMIGRGPAFLSATLEWQGATHQFKKLTPEMYTRIPSPGKGGDRRDSAYVRFELGILVREERNIEGQMVVLQIPSLVMISREELVTGSVPSGTVASGGTSPGSAPSAASVPSRQAVAGKV